MKVSVAGFKCVGTWDEVVNHGERITAALEEYDVDEAALEQWKEWQPAHDENIDDEITERTVEQASVSNGKSEEEETPPSENAKKAAKKVAESSKEAADASPKSAGEELKEGAKHAAQAADSAGRKTLRAFEKTVYEHVMTKVSPYYFDNSLISANIQRKSEMNPMKDNGDEELFVFEINVNDDDLKASLKEEFSEELEEK